MTISGFHGAMSWLIRKRLPKLCSDYIRHAEGGVIARSKAMKQSILAALRAMDCFAGPVIGRALARPVGSQ
jgi:hypothetical protein